MHKGYRHCFTAMLLLRAALTMMMIMLMFFYATIVDIFWLSDLLIMEVLSLYCTN